MDTLISLVNKTKTDKLDEYGDPVFEESYTDIFAEETSVGYAEFYQAMTNGYKPEIRFNVYDDHAYNGQEEIIHNNVRYKVLRTYQGAKALEIVCYGGVRERTKISNED